MSDLAVDDSPKDEVEAARGVAVRGRPRSPESEDKIGRAVLAELAETPYSRITIKDIASRAGVARTTIYRRYATKFELVAAVMEELTPGIELEPTGDLFVDLHAFIQADYDEFVDRGLGLAYSNLYSEATFDTELRAFVEHRRERKRRAIGAILHRGCTNGQIRADVDIDLLIDVITGLIPHRLRLRDHQIPVDVAQRLASIVLHGALAHPNSDTNGLGGS